MARKSIRGRVMIGLRDHDNLRERLEAAAAERDEPMNRMIARLVEAALAERGYGRPQRPAPAAALVARRARKAA
jgi:hypothetical protein